MRTYLWRDGTSTAQSTVNNRAWASAHHGNGWLPPSGNSRFIVNSTTSGITSSTAATRRRATSLRSTNTATSPTSARNAPATGLASGVAIARTAAGTSQRRVAAHTAPSPNATPSRNVNRPDTRFAATPSANAVVANAGRVACVRTIREKTQTATNDAMAPTT